MLRGTAARLAGAMTVAAMASALAAGSASAEVVYNNVPAPLPGNFASIGLAATSSSEFGGEIELAGTARRKPVVTVVMSSWACEAGGVYEGNCVTNKPTKAFRVPLTVKIYSADELGEGPVAEKTVNAKMYYRPSSTPSLCEGDNQRWFDAADGTCYHGYAFPVTVKLPKLKRMPKYSVVTFSYPHSSGPAESLNVATSEPPEGTLSVGGWPVEGWFVNSTWSGMYEAGSPDVGQLAAAGVNGEEAEGVNYQPVIEVEAQS